MVFYRVFSSRSFPRTGKIALGFYGGRSCRNALCIMVKNFSDQVLHFQLNVDAYRLKTVYSINIVCCLRS